MKANGPLKVTNCGTNQKPVCDFVVVNSNNLYHILYNFQVIVAYWSNYRFDGLSLFNSIIRGKLRIWNAKLGLKKLETSLYCVVQTI